MRTFAGPEPVCLQGIKRLVGGQVTSQLGVWVHQSNVWVHQSKEWMYAEERR